MYLIDSVGLLRVATCSMDRTVVIYDILASKQVLRISLPLSLESITCNPGEDVLCIGSTNGTIFVIDLTVTAIGISASQSQIGYLGENASSGKSATQPVASKFATGSTTSAVQNLVASRVDNNSLSTSGLPRGTSVLEGHTKTVSSLSFSMDNSTLISASEDGTLRMWDVWTRQCIRECKPLSKFSITNCMV